jgi:hypothetical protein
MFDYKIDKEGIFYKRIFNRLKPMKCPADGYCCYDCPFFDIQSWDGNQEFYFGTKILKITLRCGENPFVIKTLEGKFDELSEMFDIDISEIKEELSK